MSMFEIEGSVVVASQKLHDASLKGISAESIAIMRSLMGTLEGLCAAGEAILIPA